MEGDIDIDGNVLAALSLRARLTDRHILSYLWATHGQRMLFGQINRDKKWIPKHYDDHAGIIYLFLDTEHHCYSHGYFNDDNEPLEAAIERKLATAVEACGIGAGSRVLDIGAGWGAFTAYAGRRGINVTSLTISTESADYVSALIAREGLPCTVVKEHFLEYKSDEKYDAIVNLGVTEHIPDYKSTLEQYERLLKPGGRIFLDACASRTKFSFPSFIRSYVWPGNATPLNLKSYLHALRKSPFELVSVRNDRHSYMLTTKRWAENLESSREEVVRRWGEFAYRQFRLYLWACVHGFSTAKVTAYRLLLEYPKIDSSIVPRRFRFAARNRDISCEP